MKSSVYMEIGVVGKCPPQYNGMTEYSLAIIWIDNTTAQPPVHTNDLIKCTPLSET